MAQFFGSIEGGRGKVTRLGHKSSGITTVAASWEGAVQVDLEHRDGQDFARVRLVPWRSRGVDRVLYDGPVGGLEVTA